MGSLPIPVLSAPLRRVSFIVLAAHVAGVK